MEKGKRDLLVLLNENNPGKKSLDAEVECLNTILSLVECNNVFCKAHELVMRNGITQKPRKILNAVSDIDLKPFYFLINKN